MFEFYCSILKWKNKNTLTYYYLAVASNKLINICQYVYENLGQIIQVLKMIADSNLHFNHTYTL